MSEMTWRTLAILLALPAGVLFCLAAFLGWPYTLPAMLYGAAYVCRSQADKGWRS